MRNEWRYGSEVFVMTSATKAYEEAARRAGRFAQEGNDTMIQRTTWNGDPYSEIRSFVVYYRPKSQGAEDLGPKGPKESNSASEG